MNIILSPVGSAGDVHPLVGLALALRRRGHRVSMIVSGYFSELLDRLDLPYTLVGTREDFIKLANHPDLWNPRRSLRYLFRAGIEPWMRSQYEAIEGLLQPADNLVIGTALGFGARVAREKLGFPLLTVHLQPAVLWSEYDSPRLPQLLAGPGIPRWLKRLQFWAGQTFFVDPVACPPVNRWLAELGLPPMRRAVQWWNSPDGVLGLFPEWYAPPQPDWPPNTHLSQFPLWDEREVTPLDEDLDQFLAAGEPPIAFTPGSAMMFGQSFFQAAADACRQLGRRGLLLTRFDEQIPASLPDGVRHVGYAPFSRLLPRCSATVHHGGIGSTAQGLRAGVPQLIMPMSHDQPDNAHRLAALGVGDWLTPRRFRAQAVADKLDRLLTSREVATACERVARRFDNVDPFDQACQVVESMESATKGSAV